MEPAFFTPDNLKVWDSHAPNPDASMEPAFFTPDNAHLERAHLEGAKLQWSRRSSRRITWRRSERVRQRGFAASMEPAFFTPDNSLERPLAFVQVEASMEPAFFTPDNDGAGAVAPEKMSCFNGAGVLHAG